MKAPTKEKRIADLRSKIEVFNKTVYAVMQDEEGKNYVESMCNAFSEAFKDDNLSEDYLLGSFETCGFIMERLKDLLEVNENVSAKELVNCAFADYAVFTVATATLANYPPERNIEKAL